MWPTWLHATDLRFAQNDEAKFVKSAEDQLVRNSLIGCFCFVTGSLLITIPIYVSSVAHASYPFEWSLGDPRVQYFSIRIFQFVSVTTFALLAFLRWRFCLFKSWPWEYIVVSVLSACLAASTFCISWHVATQYGMDPMELWGEVECRNSELMHLVAVDTTLTAAALFMPIRTCTLWVLFASAVLPFAAVMFGIGSPFPVDRGNNLFILTTLSVLALVGAHRNEKSARENWMSKRQVVKQQGELNRRHAAVCHILTRFCDCVVHLGSAPDFLILEPNPRLAALLMHTDGRTLEGTSICAYLASDEENTRFLSVFQGPPENRDRLEGSQEMISVRFKDIYGREFTVTASHTCLTNGDDEPTYIVGIAENEERAAKCNEDSLAIMPSWSNVSSVAPHWSGVNNEERVFDLQGNPARPAPRVDEHREEKVSVTFLHDFEVVGCSDTFTGICGPGLDPGSHLTSWLAHGRNADFLESYHAKVNELFYESEGDKIVVPGRWVLLTPMSRKSKPPFEIHADVELTLCRFPKEDIDRTGEPDECEFEVVAQADLSNFTQQLYQKQPKAKSRSSGSASSRRSGSSSSRSSTVGQGTPAQPPRSPVGLTGSSPEATTGGVTLAQPQPQPTSIPANLLGRVDIAVPIVVAL